jgi:hypothetical protein
LSARRIFNLEVAKRSDAMTDRSFRNLSHLEKSASTARLLNLLRVWREHDQTDDWRERPLFQTRALNQSLVIKHRLRRDELDLFRGRRHIATKIVLPIDSADLKSGGRYFFVNEVAFERMMRAAFGLGPDHPDVIQLRLIDELPSLDPFLLREQLRRNGRDPAACYFGISESDLNKMMQFVEREISPLVSLTLGEAANGASTQRLAAKILSNDPGDRMEALGVTLNLAPDQYQEGVFCWKGFLYYKWSLGELLPDALRVADAVVRVKPQGSTTPNVRAHIMHSRASLRRRILAACRSVSKKLKVYDAAYAALTVEARPNAFRDFLLEAPATFRTLGEQLGVLQHISSYWAYRFGPGSPVISPEELMDILMDFEAGLTGRDDPDPVSHPGAVDLAA